MENCEIKIHVQTVTMPLFYFLLLLKIIKPKKKKQTKKNK